MHPRFLTIDDVLESHAHQIARYGGMNGSRDIGLLQSAVAQPQTQFAGEYLHHDFFHMAAAYLFHIVQNHPFFDGNKRVGLEAALIFLEINGVSITATNDELVDLVLRTATSVASKIDIATFLQQHATH